MFMLVCSEGDTEIGNDIFRFAPTQKDTDKFLNVYTYLCTENDPYMDMSLVVYICICTYMEW